MVNVEDFLKANQFTIAALGVLGTFCAVTVALVNSVIALRASRTKIRAQASITVIYHSSIRNSEKPRYLTVSIRNTGVLPVHIPMGFFHWKLPFSKNLFEVIPLDMAATDQWAPQRKYPVEIKPRSSDTFFLSDLRMFQDYAKKDLIGASIVSALRSYFITALAFTDEGKVFKVGLNSSLKKELSRLRAIKEAPPA